MPTLVRATLVGIVLQIALALVHHYAGWAWLHVLFGRMMISATVGYLYAMHTGKGWFAGATGGAIAGGLCGFLGFGLGVWLGETPREFLPMGTAICVLTGAVGGPFGQMAYTLREIAKQLRR